MAINSFSASTINATSVCFDFEINNNYGQGAADFFIERVNSTGTTILATYYNTNDYGFFIDAGTTYSSTECASPLSASTTYYFRLRVVRNANNSTFLESQTITVTTPAATPPPTFSGSFDSGLKGVYYYDTVSISDASSGQTPTLSSPQDNGYPPPGLSLSGNSTTAIISGTPTTAGTYGFEIQILGAGGLGSQAFSITITDPPPSWGSSVYGDGRISTFYDQTISADYATSYSIVSGSLPAGLSFNTSSGRISGTPTTRGTSTFTIRATNSVSSVDKSFSIRIYAKLPSWTAAGADTTLNSDLRVGTSYSDAVSAVDATSYGIRPGTSLPSGLSLNISTGAITGTPTGNGTFNFTIRAFNLDNEFVERSFSLFVKRRVPVWTDQTVSLIAVQNEAYSDGVTATDAASYSLKSGSLPPGISLNTSTGVISGTPTTPGAYSFVITASNADTSPNTASIDTATLFISVGLPGGRPYIFDGTSWVQREIYVNNGAWSTQAEIYYYDGSSWQQALP